MIPTFVGGRGESASADAAIVFSVGSHGSTQNRYVLTVRFRKARSSGAPKKVIWYDLFDIFGGDMIHQLTSQKLEKDLKLTVSFRHAVTF